MGQSHKTTTLADLEWKHRIIIALGNDSTVIQSIQSEIDHNKSEIADRDIIYFLISPTKVSSNSPVSLSLGEIGELISDYFDDETVKVVLIGKDGGTKMEKSEFDLPYIFKLIDSMPMRQREMREK
jgi:hypothetical protein